MRAPPLVLLVLLASPALAATHPSLLFDASDLPRIRARLEGPDKPIADAVRAGVHSAFTNQGFPSTPNPNYPSLDPIAVADSLVAFAFAAAVWGDLPQDPMALESKTVARNYLVGICNFPDWEFAAQQGFPGPDVNLGHYLFSVSLAYDWLYPQLTPAERQTCRNKMALEGNKMYRGAKFPATSSSPWWLEQYLQNHHWVNNAGLGMAALAFQGELADAEAWLFAAGTGMGRVQSVLDLVPGGGWHEGNGYLNYGLDSMVPFAIAKTRRMGGVDYANNRLVTDYPKLRLFAMPPAQAHRREYPVWGDFSGFADHNMLLTLRYVARTQRDGIAAWAADHYCDGRASGVAAFTSWPPAQRGLLLSTILHDDTVVPTPPPSGGAWTLDYLASDLGLLLSRTSWEDGGALMAFKSGVFGGHGNFQRMKAKGAPGGGLNFSHNHADDMSVYLFADSEWQTSNVPGYFIGRDNGAPQVNKTRYANSLLVDGAGQLGEGVRPEDYRGAPWFFDRVSSIGQCGSTSHYSFTTAQGAKLYPAASGLTRFDRSVLFVERAFPVVRDVVRGKGAHRFEITYHAMDSAAQDGGWLKLAGKNDRVLGVRVLSPASFALATEAQTAVHLNKFDPDNQMTAAFVRPTADTDAVNFLTALIPSRGASWASRPRAEPVDPAVPDRGVTLSGFPGGEQLDIVFNDDPTGTSSAAGVSVTGMAGVRKSLNSQVLRAVLASGTKLVIQGTPWIEVLSGTPASLEVEPVSGGLEVSGDAVPVRLYAPGGGQIRLNGAAVPIERKGDFVTLRPKASGSPGPAACTAPGVATETQAPPAAGTPGGGGSDAADPGGGAGCASTGPGAPWMLLGALLFPWLAVRARRRASAAKSA